MGAGCGSAYIAAELARGADGVVRSSCERAGSVLADDQRGRVANRGDAEAAQGRPCEHRGVFLRSVLPRKVTAVLAPVSPPRLHRSI